VKGKKKEENMETATMELQEKEGQEDATKEKRRDAPDPPPHDPAAFIRHVQT